MWAGLMAKIHNCLKGPGQRALKASDFLPKKGPVDPKQAPADPHDPMGGTQTVEEKKFFIRSMLSEAAQRIPPKPEDTPTEMPDWQRNAVEAAWSEFNAIALTRWVSSEENPMEGSPQQQLK